MKIKTEDKNKIVRVKRRKELNRERERERARHKCNSIVNLWSKTKRGQNKNKDYCNEKSHEMKNLLKIFVKDIKN